MDIVMLCNFLDNVSLLVLIIASSYFNASLITVTLLYTLANLPGFILLIISLYRKSEYKFRFSFNNIKWLTSESLPLWGTGLLLAIYLQLDVVLLKLYVSEQQAGLYSAAVRIGVPLSVIPLSIITTIFPVIVKKINTDMESVYKIIDFSFKVMLVLLLFFGLIISFKGEQILNLLYGHEFIVASDTLLLVIWAFVFYFINQISQQLSTIFGLQKKSFYYSVILIFVYLAVLILGLKSYGMIAAGFARLLGVISGFVFFHLFFLKKEFRLNILSVRVISLIILLLPASYLLVDLNLIIYSVTFLIYTVILLFLIKFFDHEDIVLIYKFLKEPKWMKKFWKV